jgi:hypothetical protein
MRLRLPHEHIESDPEYHGYVGEGIYGQERGKLLHIFIGGLVIEDALRQYVSVMREMNINVIVPADN